MARPILLWWMPALFEVRADDTRLMDDRQYRLYEQLLEVAWKEHWDLPYDSLPRLLRADPEEISEIFRLARGLYLTGDKVRHRRYQVEYARYRKLSDRASAAAKKRWRHLKLVSDPEDS